MAGSRKPAKKREYTSPLREEQARTTRARILEALFAEAEGGATEVSFPALARRAGVSVPTVNRYFPTRRALFEAVVAEMDRTFTPPSAPERLEDLYPFIRRFYARHADLNTRFRLLEDSALTWQIRREVTVPRRRALTEALIAKDLPELGEPHRSWLVDLIVVLVSSATARSLKQYVNVTGDDAADRVEWALRALIEQAARTPAHKKGRKR